MSDLAQKAKSIFLNAIETHAPERRAAFVDAACAGDAPLRAEVERLLRAYAELGSFQEGTAPAGAADVPAAGRPGMPVGRYKLLEPIGAGGMGEVWMAEQAEPVKRLVAVKLVRPGMDSGQVLARFEAERQALALMDHPNIAKVHDAGTTPDGRPYFVMELVRGVPITQFCDARRLTPRQRLELFIPVCHAVQHAHQKGVIHRDIKPSNVLVALYEDRPVPKVIDFGVAKATGQELTGETLHTGIGTVVGTVEYMSPEQAGLDQLDVDTRSDVYSLGVLLYELLAGSPPFSRKELDGGGVLEMLRVIREQEPWKPSAKLGAAEGLSDLAVSRGTEPARLTRLLRGELDWIVMKALEKDRSRRYATANGLAADLQRYLNDEPVEAGPPTARYRLRKYARKYRKGLAVAALFVTLLVGATSVSLGLAGWALRAEKRARDNETLMRREEANARAAAAAEREASKAAAAQKKAAEDAAAEAKDVLEFFEKKLLAAGRPEGLDGGLGKDLTLRQAVDAAEAQIARAFQARPKVEASVRDVLGLTYTYLGEADRAIAQHTRALELRKTCLGPDHEETLQSLHNLAAAYAHANRAKEAIPLFEEVIRLLEAKWGRGHRATLNSMNGLVDAYRRARMTDQALPLAEETLQRLRAGSGEEQLTLVAMNNLVAVYVDAGEFKEARPLAEEALLLMRAKLPAGHPHLLTAANNLGYIYKRAGELHRALPLLEEAYEQLTARLGVRNFRTQTARHNLTLAYRDAKRPDKVVPLLEEALEVRKAEGREDDPQVQAAMRNLAQAYRDARKLEPAIRQFEELLTIRKQRYGPADRRTLESMNDLAAAYWSARRLDRSVPLFEEAVPLMQKHLGPDHLETLRTLANRGVNYRDAGRFPEAIHDLEDVLRPARNGPLWDKLAWARDALATTYERAGQYAKAEPLHREWLSEAKKQTSDRHARTVPPRIALGSNLLRQAKYAEAEAVLRECFAVLGGPMAEDWLAFNVRSMLGASLLGQKKYAEAEPLLVQGYQGLKEREAKIPPAVRPARLREAAERLVQHYEATGKSEQAAEWRKKIEAAKVTAKEAKEP